MIIKLFFLISFLLISSPGYSQIRCVNLFKSDFLPLAKSEAPLAVAGLMNLNSVRLRAISGLKKKYGINYELFARDFYAEDTANKGFEYLAAVKVIHPDLQDLIFHPGIVSRADEFVEFISSKKNLSTAQAFVQFREHLGYKIFYRALYLTKEEFNDLQLKKINLLSHGLHRALFADPYLNLMSTDLNLPTDLANQFQRSRGLLSLSVTSFPEIALAVAEAAKNNPDSVLTRSVYLLKLEIPVLDTLLFEGKTVSNLSIYKNDAVVLSDLAYNLNVESFLLFGIDKSEIKEITEVDSSNYTFQFEH